MVKTDAEGDLWSEKVDARTGLILRLFDPSPSLRKKK